MKFKFNWFEELLLRYIIVLLKHAIVVLITMCLLLAVAKCHADIPDTTIILCPEKTDTVTVDTVKTVKKGARK